LVEQRVSATLPAGVLTPRDLRDAAMARLEHAPALLGAVTLDHFSSVAPVWRPLLQALGRAVDLCWDDPGTADTGWFVNRRATGTPAKWAVPLLISPRNRPGVGGPDRRRSGPRPATYSAGDSNAFLYIRGGVPLGC
jgi:hypothetical protein